MMLGTFLRRRDAMLLVLSWALALSWVPLAAASLVLDFTGQPMLGFGVALVLALWMLKLGDMFDLFERRRP